MKGTRGRKPGVTGVVVSPQFRRRPDPPEGLTEAQEVIWRAVVTTEDPNFFATGAVQYILADYCRHRNAADRLNEVINKSFARASLGTNQAALSRLARLLKLREQETRASANLATKLRLTNQSRYVPHVAGRAAAKAAQGPRPWEE